MADNDAPDDLKDRIQNVLATWASEQDEEDLGMVGSWVLVYDIHELDGGEARYYARPDGQSLDRTWNMTQWIAKLYDTMMELGFKAYLRNEEE